MRGRLKRCRIPVADAASEELFDKNLRESGVTPSKIRWKNDQDAARGKRRERKNTLRSKGQQPVSDSVETRGRRDMTERDNGSRGVGTGVGDPTHDKRHDYGRELIPLVPVVPWVAPLSSQTRRSFAHCKRTPQWKKQSVNQASRRRGRSRDGCFGQGFERLPRYTLAHCVQR